MFKRRRDYTRKTDWHGFVTMGIIIGWLIAECVKDARRG